MLASVSKIRSLTSIQGFFSRVFISSAVNFRSRNGTYYYSQSDIASEAELTSILSSLASFSSFLLAISVSIRSFSAAIRSWMSSRPLDCITGVLTLP